MRWSEMLLNVEAASVTCPETEISGIQFDSRKVQPGDCFVAMQGETSNGNQFIANAIKRGAVAIVTDSMAETPRTGIAWAQIPKGSGRRALGRMSASFYRFPASKLHLIGVTGTNGKTTTSFLIESILGGEEKKPVMIGTIEYHIAGKKVPSPHTTPESLDLNRLFAEAILQGARDGVMEVSSHALEQERVFGVPFEVAVFTNLSRDHLDYHNNMEAYFAAKRILFEGCGTDRPRVSVINRDDPYGQRLIGLITGTGSEVITYGLKEGDVHIDGEAELSESGTSFRMHTPAGTAWVRSELVGRVNVYNILAAGAAAFARGIPPEKISQGINDLRHVPGRFQKVSEGQPFTVVVDYAHTDDALRNLTGIAREFVTREGSPGRVITLFGCGGDRDRAKRPLMGEAAATGSDFVVLTSDNPRSEDPFQIIHDALAGLRQGGGAEYTVEPDRRRAISLALRFARPGDIVLIAGKGHEKVQITKDSGLPFDDVEVAREALWAAGYKSGRGSASKERAGD